MKAVAIYCVDGRLEDTRKRVRNFITELGHDIPEGSLYGITKAGPDAACLGKRGETNQLSVYSDIELLLERGVPVEVIILTSHDECAGHPADEEVHYDDTKQAAELMHKHFQLPVVCLFDKKTETGWCLEHIATVGSK